MNEPAHQVRVRVFVRHKTTCDYYGEEGHAKFRGFQKAQHIVRSHQRSTAPRPALDRNTESPARNR